jgi:hypothetical protein
LYDSYKITKSFPKPLSSHAKLAIYQSFTYPQRSLH